MKSLNYKNYCWKHSGFWAFVITLGALMVSGCEHPINSPYPPEDEGGAILYSTFSEQPKTLDPAKSYASNEYRFIAQIYEPPLEYHYYKRPYQLMPLTSETMPEVSFLDKDNNEIDGQEEGAIAFTKYTITIKRDIAYQPHPCFVKEGQAYAYHHITEDDLDDWDVKTLQDFPKSGTRELTAHDYVYQIKRLADPRLHSPIYGFMSGYIIGLKAYNDKMNGIGEENYDAFLRDNEIEGVKATNKYTYEIVVKGYYPQFMYWLAMPFFSPYPWEADVFYHQEGFKDRNITSSWFPVGTGPYYLAENDPNSEMRLLKNPNYRLAYPPISTSTKPLPYIHEVRYILEKESLPRWNKFLQGYYDFSSVSHDNFDSTIQIDQSGQAILTPSMAEKGFQLSTSISPSIYYLGFNMLDDVVGGLSEKSRKLRQAIYYALDYREYISIFLNGRGIDARGPVPPGIQGYRDKTTVLPEFATFAERLNYAKELMVEAGYPSGVDPKTDKPLVLYYDIAVSSGPDDKARLDWLREKFALIGVNLNIRATQYNRFQEKIRKANMQIFSWGWHADYPDPENFLFLLYGPNAKFKSGGENATNYQSKEFDALFEEMKYSLDNEAREKLINRINGILEQDMPCVWGFHPMNYSLSQPWMSNVVPNEIGNNTLKYYRLDSEKRKELRSHWNKPNLWPILLILLAAIVLLAPLAYYYRKLLFTPFRQRQGK